MCWLQILASPVFAERRQRLSLTAARLQVAEEAVGVEEEEGGEEDNKKKANLRPIIDPETSIRYMKSKGAETSICTLNYRLHLGHCQ